MLTPLKATVFSASFVTHDVFDGCPVYSRLFYLSTYTTTLRKGLLLIWNDVVLVTAERLLGTVFHGLNLLAWLVQRWTLVIPGAIGTILGVVIVDNALEKSGVPVPSLVKVLYWPYTCAVWLLVSFPRTSFSMLVC